MHIHSVHIYARKTLHLSYKLKESGSNKINIVLKEASHRQVVWSFKKDIGTRLT